MSDSSIPFQDPVVDAKRQRAKERLYVLCQVFGWGGFLVMQVVFTVLFRSGDEHKPLTFADYNTIVMIVLLGFVVSHYGRRYIERWKLKERGWVSLIPRALGLALIQSLVWSIVGYGWIYGVLLEPWPDGINPFVIVSASIVNGMVLYGSWSAFYFIYHVFDRFNRSEIERLRLATVVKDAELRALKSQINPHFMFNSLNSVRALIDEDPVRARQAVTQLANMLRYSLQASGKQTVSFEDELTVVNDYLALEQVRHEERLRLRLDIAPDTLRRSIPPMLLQTLVENAVKYGISSRANGGEIAIIARIVDDKLQIAVRNPGSLAASQGNSATQRRSTGVGLRNAADRLQLLFGDSASLTLRQSGVDEVSADVLVPQVSDAVDADDIQPHRVGSLAHKALAV